MRGSTCHETLVAVSVKVNLTQEFSVFNVYMYTCALRENCQTLTNLWPEILEYCIGNWCTLQHAFLEEVYLVVTD